MNTKEKTITAPTIEELEQAEQRAMAQVAEARGAARVLRDQAEQRRAEAQQRHDQETFAAWSRDRDTLRAAADEARANLRKALLEDKVWSAYAEVVLAEHRKVLRSTEAAATSQRLHGRSWVPEPMPMAPDFDMIRTIVETAATDRGRAEQQARDQRREDVGQAAADGTK